MSTLTLEIDSLTLYLSIYRVRLRGRNMLATPFALKHISADAKVVGAAIYPKEVIYDPVAQTTDLWKLGGPSEPTTMSNVAGTTGFLGTDSDESNDDKGTD